MQLRVRDCTEVKLLAIEILGCSGFLQWCSRGVTEKGSFVKLAGNLMSSNHKFIICEGDDCAIEWSFLINVSRDFLTCLELLSECGLYKYCTDIVVIMQMKKFSKLFCNYKVCVHICGCNLLAGTLSFMWGIKT